MIAFVKKDMQKIQALKNVKVSQRNSCWNLFHIVLNNKNIHKSSMNFNKFFCKTDVDECFFNKCDDLTSTCINKFGSYDCACKEGFVKNSTSEECEGCYYTNFH